jgi:hypothetical protein
MMFRLWSEWDIDEENIVFTSKEVGMQWLRDNQVVAEIASEDGASIEACIESCFADGLFCWQEVTIIQ